MHLKKPWTLKHAAWILTHAGAFMHIWTLKHAAWISTHAVALMHIWTLSMIVFTLTNVHVGTLSMVKY